MEGVVADAEEAAAVDNNETLAGLAGRVPCPCCGYPTLHHRSHNEICLLCDWEDDADEAPAAHAAGFGPNGGHTLTEARNNFEVHRTMYAPGHSQRRRPDTRFERKTKELLIEAFDCLLKAVAADRSKLEKQVLLYERMLLEQAPR